MEYFGTNLTEHGHYRFDIDGERLVKTWQKFNDLPFHPENITTNLPNGEVVFYQGGGFTVLGISGSCVDERPGSKSIFWVKEIISKEEMIIRIHSNKCARAIIDKMKFIINW
jgi:hypothetical protein